MKRPLRCTSILVGALIMVSPALAQSPVDSVVEQLRAQGFGQFEIRRTMLGRTKIEARRGDFEREIVVTSSGRILKDEVERDRDESRDRDRDRSGSAESGDDDGDRDRSEEREREREKQTAEQDREREKQQAENDREREKQASEREREREKERVDDDRDDDDDDDS